jgi:predicted nucleotidyltransferase
MQTNKTKIIMQTNKTKIIMHILVKMNFGSHLYGTNTENSDLDIKGVYLPSIQDCILNKIQKSITNNTKIGNGKNSKEDVDCEFYSLQYFLLELGKNGDTTFLDMIHAPKKSIIQTSLEWENLQANRSKFYTKNLKAYIGYCRSQASKYGIKGSKLNEAKKILDIFNKHNESEKLANFWEELPNSEYSKKYYIDNCQAKDKRTFDFCGKKLMADCNVFFAKQTIEKFYNFYGERAKMAQDNEGIDWKAISHAFRVGYQLQEIYTTGDLQFPLKNKEFLIKIKTGNFHYIKDDIATKLEDLIDNIENLANKSNFQEQVDLTYANNFICNLYK